MFTEIATGVNPPTLYNRLTIFFALLVFLLHRTHLNIHLEASPKPPLPGSRDIHSRNLLLHHQLGSKPHIHSRPLECKGRLAFYPLRLDVNLTAVSISPNPDRHHRHLQQHIQLHLHCIICIVVAYHSTNTTLNYNSKLHHQNQAEPLIF